MSERTSLPSALRVTSNKTRSQGVLVREQRRAAASRERQPNARWQHSAARAPLQCPQCGVPLRQQLVQGVSIDQCPKCGGLWLDKEEFARSSKTGGDNWLGHVVVDLASLIAHPAPLQPEGGLKEWYWY